MNIERFEWACKTTAEQTRIRSSIGTLSEKSLHAAVKLYFEPHDDCQEVKIGDYVADIVGEDGIIEIQTRSFSKMNKKLSQFLNVSPVTVVYPIIVNKTVVCVDENTGAVTSKRKSPKHGNIYSVFDELWGIEKHLNNKNLTLCLLMIDAEEIRIYGKDAVKYGTKKQRSSKGCFKSDRIPTKLHDEIYIKSSDDYRIFFPKELPEQFTVKDFAGFSSVSNYIAGQALHLLRNIGVIKLAGKKGRAYLYELYIKKSRLS